MKMEEILKPIVRLGVEVANALEVRGEKRIEALERVIKMAEQAIEAEVKEEKDKQELMNGFIKSFTGKLMEEVIAGVGEGKKVMEEAQREALEENAKKREEILNQERGKTMLVSLGQEGRYDIKPEEAEAGSKAVSETIKAEVESDKVRRAGKKVFEEVDGQLVRRRCDECNKAMGFEYNGNATVCSMECKLAKRKKVQGAYKKANKKAISQRQKRKRDSIRAKKRGKKKQKGDGLIKVEITNAEQWRKEYADLKAPEVENEKIINFDKEAHIVNQEELAQIEDPNLVIVGPEPSDYQTEVIPDEVRDEEIIPIPVTPPPNGIKQYRYDYRDEAEEPPYNDEVLREPEVFEDSYEFEPSMEVQKYPTEVVEDSSIDLEEKAKEGIEKVTQEDCERTIMDIAYKDRQERERQFLEAIEKPFIFGGKAKKEEEEEEEVDPDDDEYVPATTAWRHKKAREREVAKAAEIEEKITKRGKDTGMIKRRCDSCHNILQVAKDAQGPYLHPWCKLDKGKTKSEDSFKIYERYRRS